MNDTVKTTIERLKSDYKKTTEAKLGVYVSKKVVSCDWCSGTGYTSSEELSDYHRREYSTVHYSCRRCAASGRVTVTTTSFSLEVDGVASRSVLSHEEEVPYHDDPIDRVEAYVGGGTTTIDLGKQKWY